MSNKTNCPRQIWTTEMLESDFAKRTDLTKLIDKNSGFNKGNLLTSKKEKPQQHPWIALIRVNSEQEVVFSYADNDPPLLYLGYRFSKINPQCVIHFFLHQGTIAWLFKVYNKLTFLKDQRKWPGLIPDNWEPTDLTPWFTKAKT